LGDSDQLKVGDVVLAIGNPFGVGQSVSRGIVSALSRGNLGIEQIEDFIQTDAAINMGNSGGALIDSLGRVVGINTAILSRTGGFAGVGFAIPINLTRNIAEQIVSTGEVNRGFLGVAPQTLTPELAAQFGTHRGALVAEVTPGSAAEKAGLQAGDIITKVNDVEIRDPRQLLLTISQLAPGSSAKIDYLRDGKTVTANATLERRPGESFAGGPEGRRPGSDEGVLDGVAVTDISPQLRQQLDIPARVQGALITQVDPTSPAAQQGLREGDIILELDRKPVKNAEEAVQLSAEIKGPKVMVRVWREGRSQYLVIDESSG
jgi:serine protease Do